MSVAAVTARERSSSLSDQLHTIEIMRQVPEPVTEAVPLQSALSVQMNNLEVSSRSGRAASLLNQPQQAFFASHPETLSMIQSHLQDAVRSVGDAVPWSAHQHLDTNSEGTKRAHVLAPEPGYQSRMDDVVQTRHQASLSSNSPVAQGLPYPMPLQMPQPLATRFPPTQSNAAHVQQVSPGTARTDPRLITEDRAAQNPNVHGMTVVGYQQEVESSVQRQPVKNGPTSFHPGFTPSLPEMQFSEDGMASRSFSIQQGVTPPSPTFGGSQSISETVCQPTMVTSMGTKVCDIHWLSRRD